MGIEFSAARGNSKDGKPVSKETRINLIILKLTVSFISLYIFISLAVFLAYFSLKKMALGFMNYLSSINVTYFFPEEISPICR